MLSSAPESSGGPRGHEFRVAADGHRGAVRYDAEHGRAVPMARELVVGTEGWPLPIT
jgi:hypothetical protein